MARKTVVELVDDLDGGPADETVRFALDGVDYAIDLSAAHAERLRAAMATFLRHARRPGHDTRRALPANGSGVVSPDEAVPRPTVVPASAPRTPPRTPPPAETVSPPQPPPAAALTVTFRAANT